MKNITFKLNELLKLENDYRESADKNKLFSFFHKMNGIFTFSTDNKCYITSKIFLY